MPKLSKSVAKKVANTEISTGDFPLLDNGWYFARLAKVDVREGQFAPRWTAEFEKLHKEDGTPASGRQWYDLNVPTEDEAPSNYDKGQSKWDQFVSISHSFLHGFFEAFGYTTDSDTDELVGEWVKIKVGTRTIQRGDRKGEKANEIKALAPVEDDFEPFAEDEDDDTPSTF